MPRTPAELDGFAGDAAAVVVAGLTEPVVGVAGVVVGMAVPVALDVVDSLVAGGAVVPDVVVGGGAAVVVVVVVVGVKQSSGPWPAWAQPGFAHG